MNRALVCVWGRRMRLAPPDLTPEAQTAQHPRAEPAGSLAQLCLLGLSLVGVADPHRVPAASPHPSHPVSVRLSGAVDPDDNRPGHLVVQRLILGVPQREQHVENPG